jgi:geranylgeranyl pyrophosphate synthase
MTTRRRYPEVASVVRGVLVSLGEAQPSLATWITDFLERPGWVLARQGRPRWSSFVVETCRVLSGDPVAAAIAAAMVEFVVAAIDITDDIVDGDWTGDARDQARAVNASVGLTLLAHRTQSLLATRLGVARAATIADRMAVLSLATVDAQDRDILMQDRLDVSEDEALDVTRRKSGSLVRMAFEVGAAVASDSPELIEVVGSLGEAVGTIAQLLNDLAGLDLTVTGQKTDFRARTKTAPVAFLLQSAREDGHTVVLDWYTNTQPCDSDAERELARLAHDLGALDFAWILADTCRREASATLVMQVAELKRPELLELLPLLPSVRARPTRTPGWTPRASASDPFCRARSPK